MDDKYEEGVWNGKVLCESEEGVKKREEVNWGNEKRS